ncbi:hypothetical protein [Paucibacter sp. KCTC 42545]|uniref:hypothetical protein n=1 Tax=Paucibacter sp. KCTC 42545 TaxID=1768242 RepID=UPI000733B693|nr:hypothetical protein [Paucibacter sp. KCTC 42545]ALT77011.1 hypothetical protein AT984_07200 [Paucibacter sp. KCTC 42545]
MSRYLDQRPRGQARSIWLAWLCALCLLAAQGLGHWHRVAHATAGPVGLAQVQSQIQTKDVGRIASASLTLWGHQLGDNVCSVFDHIAQDNLPHVAAPVVLAELSPLRFLQQAPASAAAQPFWKRGARGPPHSA